MSKEYENSSHQTGRSLTDAKALLSRLTHRIRAYPDLESRLRASGQDTERELRTWDDERKAVLAEVAKLSALRTSTGGATPCPSWVHHEDGDPPASGGGLLASIPGSFIGRPGSVSGYVPAVVTEGANEFPSGELSLSSEPGEGSVGFAGQLVVPDSGHWYRDWQFLAQLPPAPFDGRVSYDCYLFTHSWWYASCVSLQGWLQLFISTFRPSLGDLEGFCETEFLAETFWPGDPDTGVRRHWSFVSGEASVKAGQALNVGFRVHAYAGLTDGCASVMGGFMTHGYRSGGFLRDPWPPPNAGEIRFTFTPPPLVVG